MKSMKPKVAIIDYGVGNLYSIQRMLEKVEVDWIYTCRRDEIFDCQGIILPGVGAFRDASEIIANTELSSIIKDFAAGGRVILGICLGMQLLFDSSTEGGSYSGLGLLKGRIVRLPNTVKVPHTGWNSIAIKRASALLKGMASGEHVYYTHSYYLESEDSEVVAAGTAYGVDIPAAVNRGNIYGVQFHPEKSGEIGKKIINNLVV